MAKFDIDTLLDIRPPEYMCAKCCALNSPNPWLAQETSIMCEVCNVEYVPTSGDPPHQLMEYLHKVAKTGIRFEDPIKHCQQLALLARGIRSPGRSPPLRTLLRVFLQAKQFIHFTTFGISDVFIGALKVVSQRVKVRGIVSAPADRTTYELQEFESEAPDFHVQVFKVDRLRDVPHSKLIVIDGMLALKGSPNLTTMAWRKIEKNFEMVEVVTDLEEVMRLHNQYFSPIWGERSEQGDRIELAPKGPDNIYSPF